MRFNIGDGVCLTIDKEFADGKKISAGTCGIVKDQYEIFGAYLVKFEGVGLPRMILDDDLTAE
jgi:hypothetical protein